MSYQPVSPLIVSAIEHPSVVPVEWKNFYRLAGAGMIKSDGTVFLHERTARNGKRRLVAIDLHACGCFGERAMNARVFVPASLFSRGKEIAGSNARHVVEGTAIVYSATPDQTDASHFVIKYDYGQQTRVIDGWLTDDDRVVLEEQRESVASLTP